MSGYWFLASPFSTHPEGPDVAFDEICQVAGDFAKAGISAFSPIAHSYPIARALGLDPFDYRIWFKFNDGMMTAAKGLIVVKLNGWHSSFGVKQEMAYFASVRKPIKYLDPGLPLFGGEPLERIAA